MDPGAANRKLVPYLCAEALRCAGVPDTGSTGLVGFDAGEALDHPGVYYQVPATRSAGSPVFSSDRKKGGTARPLAPLGSRGFLLA